MGRFVRTDENSRAPLDRGGWAAERTGGASQTRAVGWRR